jgi:hypothetical protein
MTPEATPADEIIAYARRTITGPSGFVYQARRLSLLKLTSVFQAIPDLMAMIRSGSATRADIERAITQGEKSHALFGRVLAAALIAPKIGPGQELQAADIPWEDQVVVVNQVLAMSGLSAEAAETLRPTSGVETSCETSTPSAEGTDSAPLPS